MHALRSLSQQYIPLIWRCACSSVVTGHAWEVFRKTAASPLRLVRRHARTRTLHRVCCASPSSLCTSFHGQKSQVTQKRNIWLKAQVNSTDTKHCKRLNIEDKSILWCCAVLSGKRNAYVFRFVQSKNNDHFMNTWKHSPKRPGQLRGPPSLLFDGNSGPFPRVKWPGCKANNSPSASSEVKNKRNYAAVSPSVD